MINHLRWLLLFFLIELVINVLYKRFSADILSGRTISYDFALFCNLPNSATYSAVPVY